MLGYACMGICAVATVICQTQDRPPSSRIGHMVFAAVLRTSRRSRGAQLYSRNYCSKHFRSVTAQDSPSLAEVFP